MNGPVRKPFRTRATAAVPIFGGPSALVLGGLQDGFYGLGMALAPTQIAECLVENRTDTDDRPRLRQPGDPCLAR